MASEASTESSHERIHAILRNLFDLPTKNIESAFELILGLVKEQSSQIVDLNMAHLEEVEKNAKTCASIQNAVDGLARENAGLSADLRTLKEEHCLLLQSHATMSSLLDNLKHETEVRNIRVVRFLHAILCSSRAGRIPKLTYNLLGDVEFDPEPASVGDGRNTNIQENVIADIIDTNVDHSSQGVELKDLNEWINVGGVTSGVNGGDEESENRVKEGCNTSLKRSRSLGSTVRHINIPTKAERTVATRLHHLEQSLASIMEKTSCVGQAESQPTETKDESMMDDVKRRMDYLESILHGFEHNHKEADATVKQEVQHLDEIMSVKEEDSALATVEDIEGVGSAKLLKPESNHDESIPQGPCDNTQLGGKEGNAKTIAIHNLAHSISSLLSESKDERQVGKLSDIATENLGGGYDVVAIGRQVAELSDRLQKQISELLISVDDKVSVIELEIRIQEMRNLISAYSTENSTGTMVFDKEQKILELISNLESNMMDKDSYKRQLEHLESDMNSLICREISKLRLDLSTNVESQRHELTCLRTAEPILPNDSSIKEEYVNARIQEATDALRISLDERLDKMRLIENEMDAFSSKLAEKPSQDQIDSVLRLLEKRIGHDEELRGMMENMKLGEWYPKIILHKRSLILS
jgi:hypothetical protein